MRPPHQQRDDNAAEGVVASAGDDSPGSYAFLTLVHESTHALKSGATTDEAYENHHRFESLGAQLKLRTADYYKEVVRQIATNKGRFFIPMDADAHLAAGRSPALMQAIAKADQVLSGAWITAIRIHDTVRKMKMYPGGFSGAETWLRNVSRLMGITVHREKDLTFTRRTFGKDTGPEITNADLAIMDNKIAILAACNGKGKFIMAEPAVAPSTPDLWVDYVIRQILTTYAHSMKFSKSRDKDVIVIRTLGELHESVNAQQRNLLVDGNRLGLKELPEPMRSYELLKNF